jgi:DNA-directed RNA polymerase specialized sigma24 family protein
MTEAEVEAALAGIRANPLDDNAWSLFYAHYRGQILGMLAISGISNRDVREELAAEVFFRFARYCPWRSGWNDLPSPAVIGAYLRTTTTNVAHAWWEEVRRIADQTKGEPTVSSSENVLLSTDLISRLRPEEKRFLHLYVESGFSLSAVAAALSISYTAAGTRLHRIRRRIKEMSEV